MRLATDIHEPTGWDPDAGKEIVLIHGTGAAGYMWRRQVQPLVAAGYRVWLVDLRGHGKSVEPGETANLSVHMDDVTETLAATDIKFPTVFAGHSLGSILSLTLAERAPHLVRKVLAVSMPGKVPAPTVYAFHAFLNGPFQAIKASGIHRNFAWRERTLIETDHFTLKQIVDNFQDMNFLADLPRVECPVHFAVGRFDPIAVVDHVKQMHRAIPGSTFTVIEWAGHNCMDGRPRTFNRWFFDKLAD